MINNKKNALITGSTSGIGLAAAKVLAESGYRLMLHGLESDSEGQAIAENLAQISGEPVFYCQADLSHPDEIDKLIIQATESLGSIDVLVNNAGIQYTSPLESYPLEKWQQVMAINLTAPFLAMQKVMPTMKAQGWGRVINIASVHGLVGLTKVAAMEYAEAGVTANCICPGWTDTPLLNHQFDEYAKNHDVSVEEAKVGMIKAKAPYPEMIAPSAIGQTILFMCSEAAKGMTGTALPLDGGWTAH